MKRLFYIFVLVFSALSSFANPANISTNSQANAEVANDKAITLKSEEFVRQFSIDTNWTTLRVGFRMSATNSAAIANSRFIVGLCSGTNGYYGGTNTGHFIGLNITGTNLVTDGTIQFGASVASPVVFGTVPTNYAKNCLGKIVDESHTLATNHTFGSSFVSSGAYWAGGAENGIGASGSARAFYIDFIKGSPWTIKIWVDTAQSSTSSSEMANSMLISVPNDGNGTSMTTSYFQGQLSVDQDADGILDCVDVYWTPTLYELRIHEIRISRIQ